jgi:hypothetical protein
MTQLKSQVEVINMINIYIPRSVVPIEDIITVPETIYSRAIALNVLDMQYIDIDGQITAKAYPQEDLFCFSVTMSEFKKLFSEKYLYLPRWLTAESLFMYSDFKGYYNPRTNQLKLASHAVTGPTLINQEGGSNDLRTFFTSSSSYLYA